MQPPITHSRNWRRIAQTCAAAVALLSALGCAAVHAPSGADRGTVVGTEVALRALVHVGVPYRYGGDDPRLGFDCSGLVRHVFRDALGLELPRRSEQIGRAARAVEGERLQPGDLVFFDTQGRAYSHVGIYIGNGRFVHAPARRGRVRVDGLDDPYWAARFNGARRLAPDDDPFAAASATEAAAVGQSLQRGL